MPGLTKQTSSESVHGGSLSLFNNAQLSTPSDGKNSQFIKPDNEDTH